MTQESKKMSFITEIKKNQTKELFCGFTPNLFRNCIFASFVCYGLNQNNNENNENNDTNNKDEKKIDDPKYLQEKIISIGGFSLLGCFASQPFDYIKTIMQTQRNISMKQVIINTIKTNPLHLYKGLISRSCTSTLNMYFWYYIFFIRKKL